MPRKLQYRVCKLTLKYEPCLLISLRPPWHKKQINFVSRVFEVITSFFSGYMFGAGTTAHRHKRTVTHDVTDGAVTIATMYYKLLCCLLCMCASFKCNKRKTYNPESSLATMYKKVL